MYAYVCKVILSLSRKRERERGACRRAYLLSYVHERGGVERGGGKHLIGYRRMEFPHAMGDKLVGRYGEVEKYPST